MRPLLVLAALLAVGATGCVVHDGYVRHETVYQDVQYRYFGPHPIDATYGGGWCMIEGEHVHDFAPGYAYYSYDGNYYTYTGPTTVWYYDYHPVPGGGYCNLHGRHSHGYLPAAQYSSSYSWDNDHGGYYVYRDHPATAVPPPGQGTYGGGYPPPGGHGASAVPPPGRGSYGSNQNFPPPGTGARPPPGTGYPPPPGSGGNAYNPPPGHGGTPPGHGATPPGQSTGGVPPGHINNPGNGNGEWNSYNPPPGHGGTPPGHGATPPGQSTGGVPPGHINNPGNGHNADGWWSHGRNETPTPPPPAPPGRGSPGNGYGNNGNSNNSGNNGHDLGRGNVFRPAPGTIPAGSNSGSNPGSIEPNRPAPGHGSASRNPGNVYVDQPNRELPYQVDMNRRPHGNAAPPARAISPVRPTGSSQSNGKKKEEPRPPAPNVIRPSRGAPNGLGPPMGGAPGNGNHRPPPPPGRH